MRYAAIILSVLAFPLLALAAPQDVLLTAEPANPAPGTLVRITAAIVGGDTGGGTYTWLVNDEPVGGGIGRNTWQVTAPEVGDSLSVRVLVNGEERSNPVVLRGSSVTIEWEASTPRPPFYIGRPLLGGQGGMRAVAIPEMLDSTGGRIPGSEIRYTWRQNGAVLRSQSGYGAARVVVEPVFYDNSFSLSVLAESRDGQRVEAVTQIRPVEPSLVLYEMSPLSGLLDHKAIVSDLYFANQETSVIAYPLHASDAGSISYEWKLGGAAIEPSAGDPRIAVFRKTGSGTGSYGVSVGIRSATAFLDRAVHSFLLHF